MSALGVIFTNSNVSYYQGYNEVLFGFIMNIFLNNYKSNVKRNTQSTKYGFIEIYFMNKIYFEYTRYLATFTP